MCLMLIHCIASHQNFHIIIALIESVDLSRYNRCLLSLQEIHKKNDWFTYGKALHLVREFGITAKELDLLDERSLVGPQIRTIAHAM